MKRLIDGELVDFTPEEIEEINTPKVITLDQKKTQAKNYLTATEFYVVRLADAGTQIPAAIQAKRAKARTLLDGSFVEPPSDLFDT